MISLAFIGAAIGLWLGGSWFGFMAILGLLKTCATPRVSFWDYLGHHLSVAGADAPNLPDLVRLRSAPA